MSEKEEDYIAPPLLRDAFPELYNEDGTPKEVEESGTFPIAVSKKKWDLRVVIQVVLKQEMYSYTEMREIRKVIRDAIGGIMNHPEVVMTSHSINI